MVLPMEHITGKWLGTSKKMLIRLAASVWFAGVLILLFKSTALLVEAVRTGAPLFAVLLAAAAGVAIGLLKAKYLFIRICEKNIQRILALKSPKIWQFYRTRFFFFLALMIAFGNWAYRFSSHSAVLLAALAVLELSVSTALLISGNRFRKVS